MLKPCQQNPFMNRLSAVISTSVLQSLRKSMCILSRRNQRARREGTPPITQFRTHCPLYIVDRALAAVYAPSTSFNQSGTVEAKGAMNGVVWSESCQDDRSTTVFTASIDGFPIEIACGTSFQNSKGRCTSPGFLSCDTSLHCRLVEIRYRTPKLAC